MGPNAGGPASVAATECADPAERTTTPAKTAGAPFRYVRRGLITAAGWSAASGFRVGRRGSVDPKPSVLVVRFGAAWSLGHVPISPSTMARAHHPGSVAWIVPAAPVFG